MSWNLEPRLCPQGCDYTGRGGGAGNWLEGVARPLEGA